MRYHITDYMPFYRRNLTVAGPIILSQVGGALVQIIDTLMVSVLGTIALASVSFASAVFFIGFVFSNGLLMGATPIIGQLYARNDRKQIAGVMQNLLVFAIISSLLVMALLMALRYLMPYMGQEEAVIEEAIPYFTTLVISIFPYAIFLTMKQSLEGLGNTSAAMFITITSNIINIIFNYLLIYGKFGFPAMGVLGAGMATLISRISMPVMFVTYIRFREKWWVYCKEFSYRLFSGKTMKELLSVGFPIATHVVMEMSAFALSGIMMGWLGAAALAGHQIASNVSNLLFQVVLGISAATTIRVSHQYGARDYKALRMAANASIHLCLAANFIMGVTAIVLRHEITALFSSDPEVLKIGAQVLVMAGLFQLSDGMQAVGAGILRGLKDVRITMYVAILAYLVINLPLGYIFAFVLDFGAAGIWLGLICGLSVAAILFRLRYLKTFKKVKAEFDTTGK